MIETVVGGLVGWAVINLIVLFCLMIDSETDFFFDIKCKYNKLGYCERPINKIKWFFSSRKG